MMRGWIENGDDEGNRGGRENGRHVMEEKL